TAGGHGRAGAPPAPGRVPAKGPRRRAARGPDAPERGARVSLRGRTLASGARLAPAVLRVRRRGGRPSAGAGAHAGARGRRGGFHRGRRGLGGGPAGRGRRAGAHRAPHRPEGRATPAILERTVGTVALRPGGPGPPRSRRGGYDRTGCAGRLTRASRRAASPSIS